MYNQRKNMEQKNRTQQAKDMLALLQAMHRANLARMAVTA
jgi:hypothetical protein